MDSHRGGGGSSGICGHQAAGAVLPGKLQTVLVVWRFGPPGAVNSAPGTEPCVIPEHLMLDWEEPK